MQVAKCRGAVCKYNDRPLTRGTDRIGSTVASKNSSVQRTHDVQIHAPPRASFCTVVVSCTVTIADRDCTQSRSAVRFTSFVSFFFDRLPFTFLLLPIAMSRFFSRSKKAADGGHKQQVHDQNITLDVGDETLRQFRARQGKEGRNLACMQASLSLSLSLFASSLLL